MARQGLPSVRSSSWAFWAHLVEDLLQLETSKPNTCIGIRDKSLQWQTPPNCYINKQWIQRIIKHLSSLANWKLKPCFNIMSGHSSILLAFWISIPTGSVKPIKCRNEKANWLKFKHPKYIFSYIQANVYLKSVSNSIKVQVFNRSILTSCHGCDIGVSSCNLKSSSVFKKRKLTSFREMKCEW